MIFKNAAGKKVILNIEEPKAGITKAEIDSAMEVVVNNNIFNTSGGDIVEAVQPALAELKDAEAIVVLGGGSFGGVPDFDGLGQVASGAANRHLMGLRLYRVLHVPIIFSGGLVFEENGIEADNAIRLFKACGVAEQDLSPESRSRNTAENARFTKELCQKNGFRKVILVTSAYHMPRSAALFRREGVDFVPYPCDYMTNRDLVTDAFAFTPGHGNLSVTAIAMKEYLGLLAVKAGLQ